ncbi:hypothetical protein [Pseudonocardia parietis]|uniref:Uncharacterized protein n=1 Tax=Pseudonocardia parietis TaxID=570936 RepID=A0ABS4VRV7_9PSEU|nr:hypothetical protein [Pseudonocardia parietis]MBP2366662.1 hypothetical protein [Pseudonocardia parietis]
MDACWQGSLFATVEAGDRGLVSAFRHDLAGGAWVDVVPGWVQDPDVLFDRLRATVPFRLRSAADGGSWDTSGRCGQVSGPRLVFDRVNA